MPLAPTQDIIIMSAAVADYSCEKIADEKIKKSENYIHLQLNKNKDILFELGKIKKEIRNF